MSSRLENEISANINEQDSAATREENSDVNTKKRKLPANVGNSEPSEDPFANFIIDDWNIPDVKRSPCSKCKKSRKYFCYTCYVPVVDLEGKIPQIKLPIKIDIVKHAKEIDGKSTAAHAAVLAPEDVTIYTYPCIPDYDATSGKTVLVFPGKKTLSLKEHIEMLQNRKLAHDGPSECKKSRLDHSIERAIFIDSTWNQSKGIYKDPRLKGLPCVVLKERISQFWRHQEGSPRWYLATIEAVHQLLLELHSNTSPDTECHDYDNLLFFFRFMYDKIHQLYEPNSLRSYKRPLDL